MSLEILLALGQRICSRHFGCASKGSRVSTLKCALGCLLDFVCVALRKMLRHFLKHGLIAKGAAQHVTVQHWAVARRHTRLVVFTMPDGACGFALHTVHNPIVTTFEHVVPTSHETPAQDSGEVPVNGSWHTMMPRLGAIVPTWSFPGKRCRHCCC